MISYLKQHFALSKCCCFGDNSCEIGRAMREAIEPNCMRNSTLEAYPRMPGQNLMSLATLVAMREQYMYAHAKGC